MAVPEPAVPPLHGLDTDVKAARQSASYWFAGFQRHIQETAAYEALRGFFPGSPSDYLDINHAEHMHIRARTFLASQRDDPLRDLIIAAVDDYQRHVLGVPPVPKAVSGDAMASELAEKGHVTLPPLPRDTVSEIMAYLSAQPVMARDKLDVPLTLDEARNTLNIARYRRRALLACPHVMEIANDAKVLAAVERYLGATPTLLTPAAWWSFAGRAEAQEAQLFHLDIDDYRFCKLFVYLTDVDHESGPHAVVEGTNQWSAIQEIRDSSPISAEDFDDWYFRQLRKTDEEVEHYLGLSPTYLTGEAGSRFLVDTMGIHKGTLPRTADRLICQFMYGLVPINHTQMRPLAVPSDDSGAISPSAVTTEPFAYINRIFLNPAEGQDGRSEPAPPADVPVSVPGSVPPPSESPAAIVLSTNDDANPEPTQDILLDVIFDDADLKAFFKEHIGYRAATDPVTDLGSFLSAMLQISKNYIGLGNPSLTDKLRTAPEKINSFILQTNKEAALYTPDGKPNPDAVHWPNPTREPGDQDIFKTIPYVHRYGLVTKDTPIGAAGSCFAVEISKNLLGRGYNFIHTEYCNDPEAGVYYAETNPHERMAMFSANWGLLFNTPSFRQVAEKAFGIREFPRILVEPSPGIYMDPYRESVFFTSVDSYQANYEMHVLASRQALMASELFVVTLGLNECWEYIPDGSVISRNPRNTGLTGLLRHRTLTVQENIDNIQTFFDIVRAHNPKFKLLISVSPVPFLATGRADDYHVVAANGHSKATLRCAAQELVERNPDMYYFPSYEMVTTCTRNPWKEDQRHVSDQGVARVMELFDTMFLA